MTERSCTTCGESKDLEDFPRDRNAREGRRATCKVCHRAAAKKRYDEDPMVRERLVASARARLAADPEAARTYARAQYERHRETRLASQRVTTSVLRAKKAGVEVEDGITVQALRDRQGDCCGYCGCEMDFSPNVGRQYKADLATIDHMLPLSRGGGHTWENVTLACWGCNVSKKDRTVEEWRIASTA